MNDSSIKYCDTISVWETCNCRCLRAKTYHFPESGLTVWNCCGLSSVQQMVEAQGNQFQVPDSPILHPIIHYFATGKENAPFSCLVLTLYSEETQAEVQGPGSLAGAQPSLPCIAEICWGQPASKTRCPMWHWNLSPPEMAAGAERPPGYPRWMGKLRRTPNSWNYETSGAQCKANCLLYVLECNYQH